MRCLVAFGLPDIGVDVTKHLIQHLLSNLIKGFTLWKHITDKLMIPFAVGLVVASIRCRVKTPSDIAFNLIELSELRAVITKIRSKDCFSLISQLLI